MNKATDFCESCQRRTPHVYTRHLVTGGLRWTCKTCGRHWRPAN